MPHTNRGYRRKHRVGRRLSRPPRPLTSTDYCPNRRHPHSVYQRVRVSAVAGGYPRPPLQKLRRPCRGLYSPYTSPYTDHVEAFRGFYLVSCRRLPPPFPSEASPTPDCTSSSCRRPPPRPFIGPPVPRSPPSAPPGPAPTSDRRPPSPAGSGQWPGPDILPDPGLTSAVFDQRLAPAFFLVPSSRGGCPECTGHRPML